MAKLFETKIRFGVLDPLPLRGFPPGKVRLRMRNTDFVSAFVRDESGIRHFYVIEKDGFWEPIHEQARNWRGQSKPTPVIPQSKPFTVKP